MTIRSRKYQFKRKALTFEKLESRQLLAIVWGNEGSLTNDSDSFTARFGTENAVVAREIVNRAIDDWERVITDFNYDDDDDAETNNVYNLTVNAGLLSGPGSTAFPTVDSNGLPTSTTITLDNDGGGAGWHFDTNYVDDAEFTSITTTFEASYIDSSTGGQLLEFYRVVTHEIGHAMGISSSTAVALNGLLTG